MDELIKRLINYCEEMAGASLGADDIYATYAPLFNDVVRDAVKATYLDAVAYLRETASEHNFNIYGKRELEMVANLLELRANGEEIT